MEKPNGEFMDLESSIIEDALNSENSKDSKNIKLIYEVKDDSKEWMRTIYEEAWRLYRHEDENAAQRNSSYLTILVLLFTGIGYIAFHIIESFSIDGLTNTEYYIKTFVSLGLIIAISILILLLLQSWLRITRAGHVFEELREDIIQKIELKLDEELNGNKTPESLERFFSISLYEKDNKEDKLDIIANRGTTEKEKELDGFINTERIISTFRRFAWVTLFLSASAIIAWFIYLLFG